MAGGDGGEGLELMEHQTQKAHYGYVVTADKIAPLAGGRWHYAAKVTRLLRYNEGSPATELPVPVDKAE